MGFWTSTFCPVCGYPEARKFLWMVKCANPQCAKHAGPAARPQPVVPKKETKSPTGGVDPGANAVVIRYRNHQGQEKDYKGDRRTLRVRGKHVSVCLAPTGRRVSFLKARLLNVSELEPLLQAATESRGPTPVERQILGYYKKRGKTSPRYEEILRKYGLS